MNMSAHAARPRVLRWTMLLAIGLLSTGLITYEIVLMRRLLVERWHHFGYLVISVALLGFGASGTLLAVLGQRVRRAPVRTIWWGGLACMVALLVLPRVVTVLPVTVRFLPADIWEQVGWWSLYWLAALVPLLCGAMGIGAALIGAGEKVGRVYAANLVGSGLGALVAIFLVSRLPLVTHLWPVLGLLWVALVLVGGECGRGALRGWRGVLTVLVGVAAAVLPMVWPLRPDYDEYKAAAYIRNLVRQGSAERVARGCDPHGYVEVYASELFHNLPFLSLHEAPPPMLQVLINGDPAGSVLRVDDAAGAGVMDHTLMAFPYRLVAPQPRVLLIGEVGGANVWLARRQAADEVVVVQPNAALLELLREEPIAGLAGRVLSGEDVRVVAGDARSMLARKQVPYDLIQIVSLEGLGLGGAGARGLAEDHLLTVEGLASCWAALSERGALVVGRGLQTPPRENIRILATLRASLELCGVELPAEHIVQVRDYLGACTLALKVPLSEERREELRGAIGEFQLTPVWFAGISAAEVNQPDRMPGPAGSEVDWLHAASRRIFSGDREEFFDSWMLNVRPPTDDSPFFWDFYKPGAVEVLREAYGPLWLTRAELGRLFLYASIVIAGVAAFVLILLPLVVLRRSVVAAPALLRVQTVVYFAALGLGFMGLEMALISRAIRVLGDPVVASAAVIGGVLLLSGVGSALAERWPVRRGWLGPTVVVALGVVMYFAAWQAPASVSYSAVLRVVAIPLALAMGVPMPWGRGGLQRRAPGLVPWAWGVNGVASVVATSAAIILAMQSGYRWVVLVAVGLYLVAAVVLPVIGGGVSVKDGGDRSMREGGG